MLELEHQIAMVTFESSLWRVDGMTSLVFFQPDWIAKRHFALTTLQWTLFRASLLSFRFLFLWYEFSVRLVLITDSVTEIRDVMAFIKNVLLKVLTKVILVVKQVRIEFNLDFDVLTCEQTNGCRTLSLQCKDHILQ